MGNVPGRLASVSNSVVTIAVLVFFRLGRITRYLHETLGWRPGIRSISFEGAGCETLVDVEATKVDVRTFKNDHLTPLRPLVVRGAVNDWPAVRKWTWEFFSDTFGSMQVKVQGRGFGRLAKLPLQEFLATFGSDTHEPGRAPSLRYSLVRAFVAECFRAFGGLAALDALCGPSFTHAAFRQLREDWWPPCFLPKGGYTFPFTLFIAESPRDRFFYDWGLYMAPKGAVTRLHVDGFTHAVLMLTSGRKRVTLLPPSAAHWFMNVANAPDDEPLFEEQWAALSHAQRNSIGFKPLQCTVQAGDFILIPQGWAHEVYTEEDSAMITYNFCHGLGDLTRSAVSCLLNGYGGGRLFRPPGLAVV